VATYITDLLHVFGAISGPRGGIGFPVSGGSGSQAAGADLETTVLPYVQSLAEFRNLVRDERKKFLHPKPAKTIRQEEDVKNAKKRLDAKLKDMQQGRTQKATGAGSKKKKGK